MNGITCIRKEISCPFYYKKKKKNVKITSQGESIGYWNLTVQVNKPACLFSVHRCQCTSMEGQSIDLSAFLPPQKTSSALGVCSKIEQLQNNCSGPSQRLLYFRTNDGLVCLAARGTRRAVCARSGRKNWPFSSLQRVSAHGSGDPTTHCGFLSQWLWS